MENIIKKAYSTQSKTGQNALIQSKVLGQTKIILGDTIENMDIEIKQKHNKKGFLEIEIGLPDSKVKD